MQISHQVGVEGMTRHLPEAQFRNVIYLSPYIFYLFRWSRERIKLVCGTCVSRGCMSASTNRKIVISENITFFFLLKINKNREYFLKNPDSNFMSMSVHTRDMALP